MYKGEFVILAFELDMVGVDLNRVDFAVFSAMEGLHLHQAVGFDVIPMIFPCRAGKFRVDVGHMHGHQLIPAVLQPFTCGVVDVKKEAGGMAPENGDLGLVYGKLGKLQKPFGLFVQQLRVLAG